MTDRSILMEEPMPPDLASFDKLVDERFDTWVDELRDFCTIPSETAHLPELERAATWTEQRLRAAGAEVTVLREDGVAPVVVGELGSGPRTLVAVQHYDVQPSAPLDLWETPPFDPQIRDGRLYARGVCDDKGELLHRIQSVEALRDATGELPCRVRFIVEGEEESDSAHLAPLLERQPGFFEGHGALIEGGGVDEKGRPQLVCGVRGMAYVELTVRTLGFDAHSGGAQLLPNAAWRLLEVLQTLRSPNGAILIDDYMADVALPTEAQLAHLRTLPFEEEEIKRIHGVTDFVGGLTGFQAQIADTFQPTCNISGIVAGWTGPSVKTIVPAEASAKLDMRLIPNQDPARAVELLRAHLDRRGFTDVALTVHRGEHPYWTPIDDPLVGAAERAHTGIFDEQPLRWFSAGGTAPMHQVCAPHHLPMVTLGASDAEVRAHAPNESYSLDLMRRAVRVTGRFLHEFAALT
jgi:acetylornithine deacetylase/succinyl-diaminopimelate desuccinylase-like protein